MADVELTKPLTGMHYNTSPLEAVQRMVDAENWISEAYIYGGYARALLGYPPFSGRQKFGPGHDIDISILIDFSKTLMALDDMRERGVKPFRLMGMTEDQVWNYIKERVKEGEVPLFLLSYLETRYGKVDPYPLEWIAEELLPESRETRLRVRIKPKPIEVYPLSEGQNFIVPVVILMLFFVGIPVVWWVSWQVTT